MYGTIHDKYFSVTNVAKLVTFWETYYILTKQYGVYLSKSSFVFIASKASFHAKHVAIKNRIQHLACISSHSYVQVQAFIDDRRVQAYETRYISPICDICKI